MGIARRHPLATDAAIAVLLCAFVLQDVLGPGDYFTASKAIYVPAALLTTLPLALRRRAPLTVALVVMTVAAGQSIAVGDANTPDSALPAWLLAIYTMAAGCERGPALVGLGVTMAAGLIWMGVDDFLLPVVVLGGAWLAGRFARQTREHARIVEERSEALLRAREADARAAAAEERARIARELHDVVAHTRQRDRHPGGRRATCSAPRARRRPAKRSARSRRRAGRRWPSCAGCCGVLRAATATRTDARAAAGARRPRRAAGPGPRSAG